MKSLIVAGALALLLQQGAAVRHPEQDAANLKVPAWPARVAPKLNPPNPVTIMPDGSKRRNGLTPPDYAYTMAAGVTAKEVVYFSDGIACYAKIFLPRGFSPANKIPAVVLGQGQAGTHVSIEKYGARMAEKGLVAMVIDYRGWGFSEGFPMVHNQKVGGDFKRDETRFDTRTTQVTFKRTRLQPRLQQEDYKNAISYIQGEPGVDPDRIGLWGSSLAGGNVVVVAGQDARVKAMSIQVAFVGGATDPQPARMSAAAQADAIRRAREGQGAETTTGFSRTFAIDVETQENNPAFYATKIGNRPFQAVVAENDTVVQNALSRRAYDLAQGPKNYIVVPRIGHFDMYVDEAFDISANAAADFFVTHLNSAAAVAPPPAPAGRGGPAPTGAGPGRGAPNSTAPAPGR